MPHRDDFDDDLMDPSSEAYEYKPVSSSESGQGKAAKMFIAVTAIAAIAGGAWYFVGGMENTSDNVPVVRADTNPTKLKPSEPGGMEVPNRDKTVYERVSKENTEPKLERLLPRPEKPLEKPKAELALPELSEKISEKTGMPAITKDLPEAPSEENSTIKPDKEVVVFNPVEEEPELPEVPSEEVASAIEAPPPAPVVDENAPRALVKRAEKPVEPQKFDQDALAAKIAEALNEKGPAEPKMDPPKKVEPSKPVEMAKAVQKPVAAPQKGYAMQLLSSKSKSGVEAAWKKIKGKNGDIVNTLPANIVKADLGDKGIYYRLRLGPVTAGDKAKDICGKLKQRNVGCFIVRIR